MARQQRPFPIDFLLDYINPRRITDEDQADLDDDMSAITPEGIEVFKFLFRIMEGWKFLPVEARDGGLIKGKYLGEVDDTYEVAQQIIKLLENRFGKGRAIDNLPSPKQKEAKEL